MANITLAELFCSLRQRLLDSLDQDDRTTLSELYTTFEMLLEAAHNGEKSDLTVILDSLAYSAQHGAMGVQWKARAEIPSEEAIRAACAESNL